MNVKLRKIGNSEGVILPKELLNRLNLRAGDELTVVETTEGFQLVPATADLAAQLAAAREGMEQYRAALRELAK
jgi:putative addiction module antidote